MITNTHIQPPLSTILVKSAEQILDANKDVKKVIVDTPYTVSKRGGITVSVDRVKTYPNPQDKTNPYVRTGVSVVAEDPSSATSFICS